LGKAGAKLVKWSESRTKKPHLHGATGGFTLLTFVEMLDDLSTKLGAIYGDFLANASESALYIGQEILWNKQRNVPKFSFHQSVYPSACLGTLG
jgi:hypothetical protein